MKYQTGYQNDRIHVLKEILEMVHCQLKEANKYGSVTKTFSKNMEFELGLEGGGESRDLGTGPAERNQEGAPGRQE